MITPIDSDSLWLVLMHTESGEQLLRVWRAPPGRDGLRRIFRAREDDARPVAATTMTVLTHSKTPLERLNRWKRLTGGQWFVAWVNTGEDIPGLLAIKAHSVHGALQLLEGQGHTPLGAIEVDHVKTSLSQMQELLHGVPGSTPDMDLVRNPPPHDTSRWPSQEELAAIALKERDDVWNRTASKT